MLIFNSYSLANKLKECAQTQNTISKQQLVQFASQKMVITSELVSLWICHDWNGENQMEIGPVITIYAKVQVVRSTMKARGCSVSRPKIWTVRKDKTRARCLQIRVHALQGLAR